jgi:seryl-tRNA synthetase
MLQVSYIRENKEKVLAGLLKKRVQNAATVIEEVLSLDDNRKKQQTQMDAVLAEINSLSATVGRLYKEGKQNEANELKARSTDLKDAAKEHEIALKKAGDDLHRLLVTLPNVPFHLVPHGNSPEENETVFSHGEIPTLPENAKPHWELTQQYDLIDFELGVKLTGAGFPVYKGKGAKLQRALINFFLQEAESAGYTEIQPPILVNEDSGFGTGQLPDKEGQMYHVGIDNLYLIPTAEVPVTNIYRDMILKAEQLPVKNMAYTPCFRREAGSYGKDVRGLNRLHQFDKVEIVQVAHPEASYAILEEMREYVAGLLKKLELPFRTLRLCGGDMSFASAMTYDMEVYSAAQQRWLEVSSVSNFETFQSNRLKLRFRETEGKPMLAHTLNGSALALPRIVAALLENNQSPKGIKIPAALVPFTGFEWIN